MSGEAIAFNEHVFISAATSFFHVSSPTLAVILSTILLFGGIFTIATIIYTARRLTHYFSRRANQVEHGQVTDVTADVEANAGKEAACPHLSTAVVNGLTEEQMIEFMPSGVAESYRRLTGRRQPIIACGTPANSSVSSWYGSVTTDAQTPIRPGAKAVQLERDESISTKASDLSWTSSEAYRFVNGYTMSTRSTSRDTQTNSDIASMASRVSSLGSYVEGNSSFIVNHNFRFPLRRYSNASGDSHFNISLTSSERLSFVNQSLESAEDFVRDTNAAEPIIEQKQSHTRPRPVTWHATTTTTTSVDALRGTRIVLPIEHHLKASFVEGTVVQTATEKMIAMSAEDYHEVEKTKWTDALKEAEEENGGKYNIGGQWGAAVSVEVQTAPVEDEKKATNKENEVLIEADLADGDADGIYEDVYITSIGEKLGKKGKELLGKDVALQDRTSVFAERTNIGDSNGDDKNSVKVPRLVLVPATDATPWRKSGFKRHRQLRPLQLGY